MNTTYEIIYRKKSKWTSKQKLQFIDVFCKEKAVQIVNELRNEGYEVNLMENKKNFKG